MLQRMALLLARQCADLAPALQAAVGVFTRPAPPAAEVQAQVAPKVLATLSIRIPCGAVLPVRSALVLPSSGAR